ncbi:6-phosphogluconolactonase [Sandaracinobacter neustonicus]|uniref:6-phosphogluconolactonase n=1 Tax=Sandaracinobacter neustonicus TaxID=1715348 RepID=A0A501XF33_9SPHN|nr:6-phosphogluconolactonase [Sandaracinobacter neustonicus]TPE59130.1 6-phosphogluconolactonase [Sandaracinobacter neustonicus]
MIDAEWWDYDSAEELAEAVAGDAQFVIESALDARGDAVVAFAGGRTPDAAQALLAKAKLKWKSVTIVPTDDRLVPVQDKASNVRGLAERFLPLGARVLPLTGGDLPVEAAGKAADARLQAIHWPLDFVWLGMGEDGHTASIFPGADLETALSAPHRAIGVTPDPLPAEAPFARVTLTKSAILGARAILIHITGEKKRKVLEKALKDGAGSQYPIGRLLADATQAIDIHWCP